MSTKGQKKSIERGTQTMRKKTYDSAPINQLASCLADQAMSTSEYIDGFLSFEPHVHIVGPFASIDPDHTLTISMKTAGKRGKIPSLIISFTGLAHDFIYL